MLKVYDGANPEIWNECVNSFENNDVYYLYDYAHAYNLHGDGREHLIYYEDDNNPDIRLCYIIMERDVADDHRFKGYIERGMFFDWESPYGYGGPLADGEIPVDSQNSIKHELFEYCNKNGIVSQFFRLNPVAKSSACLSEIIETRYLRDTVFIDTSSLKTFNDNMHPKCRNMIRKAIKNGVKVKKSQISDYKVFKTIYKENMDYIGADKYYYFEDEYYDSIARLSDNSFIIYAEFEQKIIGAAVFLYNENRMHYHLSGVLPDYRDLACMNLILYEAAKIACEMKISVLHLGGGVESDDTLFRFKAGFNRNGRCPFYVGRTIFDRDGYERLLNIRKEIDPEFDTDNSFMIQYRR